MMFIVRVVGVNDSYVTVELRINSFLIKTGFTFFTFIMVTCNIMLPYTVDSHIIRVSH